MLIDTDVLTWLFRGRRSARAAIDGADGIELSAIVYMELVQGMRDKAELRPFRQTIREREWRTLPVSENISHRATTYVERYALSHGMRPADALIAASAVEAGVGLPTANTKRYKVIADIELVRYRP